LQLTLHFVVVVAIDCESLISHCESLIGHCESLIGILLLLLLMNIFNLK